ncbi:unnamed protein product [Brachionus calyciflorus]|uniref:FLYWCH-type domain-containing protein n=1 Tax=Brachionus calyciflorus TaxID=104777 RepID=A0A814I4C8_9BILA|nr:unnamed protein product [Brachionus calyciflorus]
MAKALFELTSRMNCLIVDEFGTVTLSQKNHPQLFFNGYYFRLVSNNKSLQKWRCTRALCNVRCQTIGFTVGEQYSVSFEQNA